MERAPEETSTAAEPGSAAPGDSEFSTRVPGRWELLRDLVAFQFKLAMDGLRDVVLLPLSLVIGIVGVLVGGADPGRTFYRLTRLGHRSDAWINLFGARHHHPDTTGDDGPPPGTPSTDEVVARVEEAIVAEYGRNRWLQDSRAWIDRQLDRTAEVARGKPGAGTNGTDRHRTSGKDVDGDRT